MTETTIASAQAGDAFGERLEPYRRELQIHCYRILGSLQDAEDVVQETLLAAWRGLDRFEERASLRVWLYRIATNRCLNALRDRARRPRPAPLPVALPDPTRFGEPLWLEPYPDVLLAGLDDAWGRPDARYEAGESISLAFVSALQHLPPHQRCVVVLRVVLGFRTEEVAAILDATDASVKGALQRARATLRSRLGRAPAEEIALPPSRREREVVSRFATAVEAGDIDEMITLLTDDAWLTMPPAPHQYQGHPAIAAFLADRACHRGANYRVVPSRANGQPALGCYLPDAHAATAGAAGLMVLTLRGDRIAAVTWFGNPAVMPRFGLPATVPT